MKQKGWIDKMEAINLRRIVIIETPPVIENTKKIKFEYGTS
jgi:hypothetical protein